MPDASVRIAIQADDQSSAAISQVQAKIQAFKAQSETAGGSLDYSMRSAKESTRLLSEEVGVHLSRSLTNVIAQSTTLGPLMASAFSIFAAVAFVQVIAQAATKMSDLVAKTFIFTDAMKEQDAVFAAINKKIEEYTERAKKADVASLYIGMTGANKTNIDSMLKQEELDAAKTELMRLRNQIYGKQHGFPGIEGGPDVDVLIEQRKAQVALVAALTKEQGNILATGKLEVQKELTAEVEKHTAALQKLALEAARATAAIDKQYLDWFTVIHKARQESNMQTADYGAKPPANPLIASEYPGGVHLPGQEVGFDTTNVSMLEINASVIDSITKKLALMTKEVNYTRAAWTDFGKSMGSALEQGILMGRSWTDIFSSIGFDVVKLIAKMTILKELSSSMKAGGATGFFSNMISGFFGGAMAGGGSTRAGSSYLVGESGPELFRSDRSGSISPIGSGGNISVQVINNSSQPVGATAKPSFDVRGTVVKIVLEDLASNGPLRQALGSR
jgi:hypothetical protein